MRTTVKPFGTISPRYITKITDELIEISDFHESDTLAGTSNVLYNLSHVNKEAVTPNEITVQQIPGHLTDFNGTNKAVCYLALQDTKF